MTSILLFSLAIAVYTAAPWSLSAPPRIEVVSVLWRQDNFLPSRRPREDGLEDFQLATERGGQSKYPWHPRRGETNDAYMNSESLQVQTWSPWYLHPKQNITIQVLGDMWRAYCFRRLKFYRTFMDRTPLVARVFHFVLVCAYFWLKRIRYT